MIKHIQEHLVSTHPGKGSCYPTVLACLLDKPLNEVPYFNLFYWNEQDLKNIERVYADYFFKGQTYEEADENSRSNYNHRVSIASNLWDNVLNMWLASLGYRINYIDPEKYEDWLKENPDTFYMAEGKSSRGVQHICIYQNGKLYHDPHPSGEGIIEPSENYPYTILEKV